MRERATRRVAGLLAARLPELALEKVPDPRARSGWWKLSQILGVTLLGLMVGCRSLSESEALTERLAWRRSCGASSASRVGSPTRRRWTRSAERRSAR